MKVVVTGPTGFVGNLVARRLVAEGYQVLGAAHAGWKPRVPPEGVEPVRLHDVLHHGEFDALIHAAGPSNVRMCHEQPVVAGYAVQEWSALLERAWINRARVILLSSHSVYGKQETQPIPETATLAPRSIYGAMKAAQEALAMAFFHAKGLRVTVLRCTTLVGGAERPDALVRKLAEAGIRGDIQIDGTGQQTRGLCDVEDAVDVATWCLERGDVVGEAYNISGGENVSIADLAQYVAGELVGLGVLRPVVTFVTPRSHEEGSLVLSLRKAREARLLPELLGVPPFWEPRPWRAAVRRTVKWCLEAQA